MYATILRDALPRVQERIERARERAGRVEPVTLVAVTKSHPVAAVTAALEAGLRDLGENRVQELSEKVDVVGRDAARWHLIGHLQRNKVRHALPLADLVHSIDSIRLAEEISREAERTGTVVAGLVQVNASGESSKSGLPVVEALESIARIAALPGLRIEGLMTMAPFVDDEAILRATFRATRELFERCGREVAGFEPRHLSMGMSNDFELAVEEGSTMVRVGTVLFGERHA